MRVADVAQVHAVSVLLPVVCVLLGFLAGRFTSTTGVSSPPSERRLDDGGSFHQSSTSHSGSKQLLEPYDPKPVFTGTLGDEYTLPVTTRVAEYSKAFDVGTIKLRTRADWLAQVTQTDATVAQHGGPRPTEAQLNALGFRDYDWLRFERFAYLRRKTGKPLSLTATEAYARRWQHAIEKGLIVRDWRPNAGLSSGVFFNVESTTLEAQRMKAELRRPRQEEDLLALGTAAVMRAYIEIHLMHGNAPPSRVLTALRRINDSLHISRDGPLRQPYYASYGGVRKIDAAKVLAASGYIRGDEAIDLTPFFSSRHSVREFDTTRRVEPGLVIEAVRRAIEAAPSVCNRQGARVYMLTSEAAKAAALKHQNGNKGWGDQAAVVLVLAASQEHYVLKPEERYQGFIDGGMFSMAVLMGLHSVGLASCPLNWEASVAADLAMRKSVAIPSSDSILMLVAVGHYPKGSFYVTASPRKPLADVLFREELVYPPVDESSRTIEDAKPVTQSANTVRSSKNTTQARFPQLDSVPFPDSMRQEDCEHDLRKPYSHPIGDRVLKEKSNFKADLIEGRQRALTTMDGSVQILLQLAQLGRFVEGLVKQIRVLTWEDIERVTRQDLVAVGMDALNIEQWRQHVGPLPEVATNNVLPLRIKLTSCGTRRMPRVFLLHRRDLGNTGDQHCTPLTYFDELRQVTSAVLDLDPKKAVAAMEHIRQWNITKQDVVIIGGGAILSYGIEWATQLRDYCVHSQCILWAPGAQMRLSLIDSLPQATVDQVRELTRETLAAAKLIALRDNLEVFAEKLHLPKKLLPATGMLDASCMHLGLDCVSTGSHNVPQDRVAYIHKKFHLTSRNQDGRAGLGVDVPSMKNEGISMCKVVRFLCRGQNVVSSSYHGAIWSVYLNRTVWMANPNGNFIMRDRFDYLPFQLPTWPATNARNSPAYPLPMHDGISIRDECRRQNVKFYREKVRPLLADTLACFYKTLGER